MSSAIKFLEKYMLEKMNQRTSVLRLLLVTFKFTYWLRIIFNAELFPVHFYQESEILTHSSKDFLSTDFFEVLILEFIFLCFGLRFFGFFNFDVFFENFPILMQGIMTVENFLLLELLTGLNCIIVYHVRSIFEELLLLIELCFRTRSIIHIIKIWAKKQAD